MNRTQILNTLQTGLPNLLAVYAFGSRLQGTANAESDLDLAVLVAGYADPLVLWQLAGELADIAACPVDLLDMRAASTVMQYQIITTGQCWWAKDLQAPLFEAMILSEKTALDTARAGILSDIQQQGHIYAR
ncbi:MAG: nucleotidyltransferase domain-containing protein [Gallionella sp.]